MLELTHTKVLFVCYVGDYLFLFFGGGGEKLYQNLILTKEKKKQTRILVVNYCMRSG